ncbi:TolB family protein [Candidatus Uabimicrobium amorphum]|uniref:Protein TolB n=1 Tax=Uabimicrobium amorphum TaxID=2596890 RepID=A0A5S9IN49_UABAM|nr:PD40 domain-containing protein [Candidatus Uabimicrobium amorphum]BBM84587.1 protein TolB [Candidatus Uabimicrobium amorphum]
MAVHKIYIILFFLCGFIYAEMEPGIYFSRKGDNGFWSVHFYCFSDKSTTCVLQGEDCDYGTPACSPDGKYVAFTTNKRGRYDLVYFALNTKNDWKYTTNEANNSHPTWSADSKKIAYVSTRGQKTQIFVYDIHTKKEQCITSSFAIAGQPSWHPQHNKIAFCGNRDLAVYDGRNDIFIYDVSTDSYTKVTPGDDSIKESHPVWDFDGTLLFDQSNIEYIGGMPVAKDSFIVKYEKQQISTVAKGGKFYSYPATLPKTKNMVFLRHEAGFRFSIVYYENKRFITELTFGHTDRTPRFGYYFVK